MDGLECCHGSILVYFDEQQLSKMGSSAFEEFLCFVYHMDRNLWCDLRSLDQSIGIQSPHALGKPNFFRCQKIDEIDNNEKEKNNRQ